MNLLAALLVVVRYTLHNVKTFILVIYCVVLRSSSTVPPLYLHSFTIKPLDLHWSNTGLTLEQHWPYSYPTFVLRQMTMRYSVTPKSYPREPLIAVWSLLYVRSPYTPLTTALFQHFSKKNPKSFVVSKNLCTFAHYKT